LPAIQDETRQLTTTISADDNFTLSNESVAITQPDGADVSPAPTVTDSPGASMEAAEHTLSAPFFFSQHGVYRVEWRYTIGSDDLIRRQNVFAAYIDVWNTVENQLLHKDVSDTELDAELVSLVRWLENNYSCLTGGYAALTYPDVEYFDLALAYLAAERYVRFHGNEFPSGFKRRVTQGPNTWEYSDSRKKSDLSPEDYWLYAAYDNLNRIGCIAYELALFNKGFSMFATAGPRQGVQSRHRIACGIEQLYIVARQELL
jgi:hypothetical protein